jgi:glycosyltransferase 2 family protein
VKVRVPKSGWIRVAGVLAGLAGLAAFVWWRGPALTGIGDAFRAVEWQWIVVAVLLNLLSVVARSLAWLTVIGQAMPPPRPRYPLVFSAFSVGLFANAVLPGRVGELARVGVLTRKLPARRGLWATLVGTVFAHRVFDLVPVLLLVLYVLATAKIPGWAITGLLVVLGVGVGLFGFALVSARKHHQSSLDGVGAVRRLVTMARNGLGVMHSPLPAAIAIFFQCIGWVCQLFAVWTAMRAFDIHAPVPAAGLVLLLMNVATVFPLWPGNIGLVQVAVASPLVSYGVNYARGIAYGFGLQAIEASVGIGVGLLFLAREGLSYTKLKVMPTAAQADDPVEDEEPEEPARPPRRARVG